MIIIEFTSFLLFFFLHLIVFGLKIIWCYQDVYYVILFSLANWTILLLYFNFLTVCPSWKAIFSTLKTCLYSKYNYSCTSLNWDNAAEAGKNNLVFKGSNSQWTIQWWVILENFSDENIKKKEKKKKEAW